MRLMTGFLVIKSFHLCWQFPTEANPVWAALMDKSRKSESVKRSTCVQLLKRTFDRYIYFAVKPFPTYLCLASSIADYHFYQREPSCSSHRNDHPTILMKKHNFTGKSSFTSLWPAPSLQAQWTFSMQFSLRSGTGLMYLETSLEVNCANFKLKILIHGAHQTHLTHGTTGPTTLMGPTRPIGYVIGTHRSH